MNMDGFQITGVSLIVFSIAFALGMEAKDTIDTPGYENVSSYEFREEVRESIKVCETDLPRSQKCVLEWKVIPDKG